MAMLIASNVNEYDA